MHNAFELLCAISVPHRLDAFLLVQPPASFSGGKKAKKKGKKRKRGEEEEAVEQGQFDVFNVNAHKRTFQAAWTSFLQLPLTASLYKRVLLHMPQGVFPSLPKPELTMDFLTSSYNVGGIVSLLALNSLFILITRHNLYALPPLAGAVCVSTMLTTACS